MGGDDGEEAGWVAWAVVVTERELVG